MRRLLRPDDRGGVFFHRFVLVGLDCVGRLYHEVARVFGDGFFVKVGVKFGNSFQGPVLDLLNSKAGLGSGLLDDLLSLFA